MNKGDTSIYTIKYYNRESIIKIDQLSKYRSVVHMNIKKIWEILDFYSPSHKSRHSDVDITYQQYIMITDPLFVITTTQNPKRIKLKETIANDKGYPTQITSQQ